MNDDNAPTFSCGQRGTNHARKLLLMNTEGQRIGHVIICLCLLATRYKVQVTDTSYSLYFLHLSFFNGINKNITVRHTHILEQPHLLAAVVPLETLEPSAATTTCP